MARTISRDPYKNFRFKVYFAEHNKLVAAMDSVSSLSWSVDPVTHQEGGNYQLERKLPGSVKYSPVTLSRGITEDRDFKEWAEAVWNYNQSNPLKDLRKLLRIELCDENGNPVISYTLYNCWVSEYKTLPDLSAKDNAIAIESVTVQHEGWFHEVLGK